MNIRLQQSCRQGDNRCIGRCGRMNRARSSTALHPFKPRNISASWDGDADPVVAGGTSIVAVKIAPQPACLQTHDRIGLRIEGLVAIENGKRYWVALEEIPPSVQ